MSHQKIALINYEMGNLNSIVKAFKTLKIDLLITNVYHEIIQCDKIILPGVGHFAQAVNLLKQLNLWDALKEAVLNRKRPILGICLGMQLMSQCSEEGNVAGFGWINARVKRFNSELLVKVPHMGWNTIHVCKENPLITRELDQKEFYFAHSYHYETTDIDIISAQTEYGYSFVSAVADQNIFGVQFHPEKSFEQGIQLFSNFVKL